MIEEPDINVGILTDGKPRIEIKATGFEIGNLLIGYGFHWQTSTRALFEGEVINLKYPQAPIYIINRLPLEKYLESVVSSEMNPEVPDEFIKAHAVISRSWAMRKLLGSPSRNDIPANGYITWEESESHKGFDVCSDDHCQRYQGLSGQEESIVAGAVRQTRGEVLMDDDGIVADTRFSKCCGGKTEIFSTCWADKDYPYLVSKEDVYCDLTTLEPFERSLFLSRILKHYDRSTQNFNNWEIRVDKEELRNRISEKYGVDTGRILKLSPRATGPSGRIKLLEIIGEKNRIRVGKELAIRRLLAHNCLYSSLFDILDEGDNFLLKGKGWGHGVGLCQIGAARMALEGKDYKEILSFYYPGAKLSKIYE